jgi:hypothetical protein
MHCAIPDSLLLDKHRVFCVANKNNGDASLFLYLLQAIHLQETTHPCRILTEKLTVFQFPTFRGILSSVTPSRDPSSIHILTHKSLKIRLKVIVPPTPCFPMSHPKKLLFRYRDLVVSTDTCSVGFRNVHKPTGKATGDVMYRNFSETLNFILTKNVSITPFYRWFPQRQCSGAKMSSLQGTHDPLSNVVWAYCERGHWGHTAIEVNVGILR